MIFKRIQRKRHAKGFGIHSPFAFHLITRVIYEEYPYYAFFDIPKTLQKSGLEVLDAPFSHLSYRLIIHFKPENALDLGSADAVNTHFIASALNDKTCYTIMPEMTESNLARSLLNDNYSNVVFIKQPDSSYTYDSVFIDPEITETEPEELFSLSSDNCFWVVQKINKGKGKHFWKKIVLSDKTDVLFEMKEIGIVVINKNLKKNHYII